MSGTLVMRVLRDGPSLDRRKVDLGRVPDRRGVRIRCDHVDASGTQDCLETVHLIDGVGSVGSKIFRCPVHGWFGPGLDDGGSGGGG